MSITIQRVTMDDLDLLTQFRIDLFKDEDGVTSYPNEDELRHEISAYFAAHILRDDFISYVAKEDGVIASGAFLMLNNKPISPHFLHGQSATLYNVFTYPAYRKRGLASQVINAIITEAKQKGVTQIDLLATEMGQPIYQKLGFKILPFSIMRHS